MASEVATQERVPEHTAEEVNARIQRQLEANVAHYARRLDEIDQRLLELDQEWDIERTLEANAGVLALSGLLLGLFSSRWRVLSAVVAGFLAQHAIQGWCPPVPVFRRMGVRTAREINRERVALRALRGDFSDIDPAAEEDLEARVNKAMRLAERATD